MRPEPNCNVVGRHSLSTNIFREPLKRAAFRVYRNIGDSNVADVGAFIRDDVEQRERENELIDPVFGLCIGFIEEWTRDGVTCGWLVRWI